MEWSERPVILLGHGCREADISPLLFLGVPILTSWQVKDMIPHDHPYYFGSPGIYGQRMANKALWNADQIVSIGNRMSIWNVGYEGPRASQKVLMVDIDPTEEKFGAELIKSDANDFIKQFDGQFVDRPEWLKQCRVWKQKHPLIEEGTHDDNEFINPHRFTQALEKYLRSDEVIVTDMGTPLICAHQVLRLKPPQRLMTSGGLGEMGVGLPAAIGASFARNKGPVLCLHADGGMMMNLQELQTIIHHKLPITIIVYRNDGYLMIQNTQRVGNMTPSGVDAKTGVSFPDYRKLAQSMGMASADLKTWKDFDRLMPYCFEAREPVLIQYWMEPGKPLYPKLDPVFVDGKPTSPEFHRMSPLERE